MDASSRMAVCGQPPGLHAHDALGRQRAADGQDALVFLGVDVVGDGDQVVLVAHGLAQHFQQVVLPEPTGPPMPTRSGGSFLVRRAMWCKAVVMIGTGVSTGFRGGPRGWPASG
jgi:hypothetical protein